MAAVRHALVVALELLLGDEVHGGLVRGEVVGHRGDGLGDGRVVGLVGHHVALTHVRGGAGDLGAPSGAGLGDRLLAGDRVLHAAPDAGDPPDGVGMALREALAPERVLLRLREQRRAQHPVHREQARVPAGGDHRHVPALPGRGVHLGAVPRDELVVVVGVHGGEVPRVAGRLLGDVRGAAEAEEQHVDLPGVLGGPLRREHGRVRVQAGAAREDAHQLHVRLELHELLHTAAEVPVSDDAGADGHVRPPGGVVVRSVPPA